MSFSPLRTREMNLNLDQKPTVTQRSKCLPFAHFLSPWKFVSDGAMLAPVGPWLSNLQSLQQGWIPCLCLAGYPPEKKGPCYMLPCLVLLSVYVIFRVTTTGPTQICQVGHDLSQVFILTQLRHRVVAKACQNGKDDCEDHIAGKPRIMRRDNTTFKLGKKKGTQSNKVETQRKAKNRRGKAKQQRKHNSGDCIFEKEYGNESYM